MLHKLHWENKKYYEMVFRQLENNGNSEGIFQPKPMKAHFQINGNY